MSTNNYEDIKIYDKPVFNSKLFIDLDINEEINEQNTSCEKNTEGSENSFELEETNCLSNELIEELDLCNNSEMQKKEDNKINNINDKNNIIDSLLSLANNGYEFKPKNYNPFNNKNILIFNQNIYNKNNYINPMMNNKYLFKPNNIYNIRDQKKDWICSFCNNLNYSFRTKCNRCKIRKEDSDKRKNTLMNLAK